MNPVYLMIAGGAALLSLLVFQVLVGLRKIKFKGPVHMKVHKWGAYALLALAVFHGAFSAGTLLHWF